MIGFQPGTKPFGAGSLYDELRTLAAPAVTFLSGGKFADRFKQWIKILKTL